MTYRELFEDTLNLRKNRDPLAGFAVAVISKAQSLAKAEAVDGVAPQPTDEHAIAALRSFLKGIDEVLERAADNTPGYRKAEIEKAFVLKHLPAAPTAEQIQADVAEFMATTDLELAPLAFMGPIMEVLKAKYGSALDGKTASAIVKAHLTGNS